MNLLLDTHTFLWMDAEPAKLSARVRSLILDPANVVSLSVASLWEIQIKAMLGKLSLRIPLPQIVGEQQQQNGVIIYTVTTDHVYELDHLPAVHNDPFDRLIAAVSRIESATLLSADPVFHQYPVSVEW
jgi:PIN domain nuclease of toxin-antitoxin system